MRHQEAVDCRVSAERHQQIRLDQHDGCLLGDETAEEIEKEQEGDYKEYQLILIFLDSHPSEERSDGNEINQEECQTQIGKELTVLVGLEHDITLLTELFVLAQQEKQLYLIHDVFLPFYFYLRSMISALG